MPHPFAIFHLLPVIPPMSATGNEERAFREAIRRVLTAANSARPRTHGSNRWPRKPGARRGCLLCATPHRVGAEQLNLANASPALLLAARCQHICRWMIPRGSYPMTRPGYLKWRTDLKQFHAKKSAEILTESGCSSELVTRVQELNLKKNLGQDAELQILEDSLCFVTLQYQLTDLMGKTYPDYMVGILQKTWKKMSSRAREAALQLSYPEDQKGLLSRALSDS